MSLPTDRWTQAGQTYWWRYPKGRRMQAGHHLTADLAGARSVATLLRAMLDDGAAAHRTMSLTRPPSSVADVTGFRGPVGWEPGRLRVEYDPAFIGGTLTREGDRMTLKAGPDRLEDFWSGFVEIEIGGGDFAVMIEESGEPTPLWFWWRPDTGRRH